MKKEVVELDLAFLRPLGFHLVEVAHTRCHQCWAAFGLVGPGFVPKRSSSRTLSPALLCFPH